MKNPETASSGGKGGVRWLGMTVLLIALGVMCFTIWHQANSLNPVQRAKLERLTGKFEGVSSDPITSASQWKVEWRVQFSSSDANQLFCDCTQVVLQNQTGGKMRFSEKVHLQYHDSRKPGYIEIAGSESGYGWKIYVESSLLKSGKQINSLLLYDPDWGQCILRRN